MKDTRALPLLRVSDTKHENHLRIVQLGSMLSVCVLIWIGHILIHPQSRRSTSNTPQIMFFNANKWQRYFVKQGKCIMSAAISAPLQFGIKECADYVAARGAAGLLQLSTRSSRGNVNVPHGSSLADVIDTC